MTLSYWKWLTSVSYGIAFSCSNDSIQQIKDNSLCIVQCICNRETFLIFITTRFKQTYFLTKQNTHGIFSRCSQCWKQRRHFQILGLLIIYCQVNKALADACNLIVHILMNSSQLVLPIKGNIYFFITVSYYEPTFLLKSI